jgi:hypothetical protein
MNLPWQLHISSRSSCAFILTHTLCSLLLALGVPGLVARTRPEYEALLHSLAIDPVRRAHARHAVELGRDVEGGLFDTVSWARRYESALRMAWDASVAGKDCGGAGAIDDGAVISSGLLGIRGVRRWSGHIIAAGWHGGHGYG